MDANDNRGEAGELAADVREFFETRGEKLPNNAAAQPGSGQQQPAVDPSAVQPGAGADNSQTTVPLRALQEEREEKKALREELRRMSEERAVLADRWQTLLNMGQQQE